MFVGLASHFTIKLKYCSWKNNCKIDFDIHDCVWCVSDVVGALVMMFVPALKHIFIIMHNNDSY